MPGKKKSRKGKKAHPKPRFAWKWLETDCSRALGERTDPVDGVFIDIAYFTHKYYDDYDLTPEGFHSDALYDRVFSDILEIVEAVDPQKVVYLGKDGSESWAKIREIWRRHKQEKVKRKKNELISFPEGPGSLDVHFRKRIRKAKKELPQWEKLEVIYDPREALGEAEHKFLQYLRNESEATRSWCVVAADKDFAFLMLSLRNPNISIHRLKPGQEFTLDDPEWNVGALQIEVCRMMDYKGTGIDDLVALASIAGTDFLPRLASWQHLVKRYNITARGRPLITDGNIDKTVLKAIISGITNDKKWTGSEKERIMAEWYVKGIYWTIRLYFGISCDWYWAYPFGETPPIKAIVSAIDDIDFDKPIQDMHAQVYKYELAWRLADENLKEAVYRSKCQEIFSPVEPTEWQKQLIIRTTLPAMEELYQRLVAEGKYAYEEFPEEAGLLWIYDSETQNERRDHICWTSTALPTMTAEGMKFTKGQFVVAEQKLGQQDTHGFLAQIRGPGNAIAYPVELFKIEEQHGKVNWKGYWKPLEQCLKKCSLLESQVFAKTRSINLDDISLDNIVLPLFIGEEDTQTYGRFGFSMVRGSKRFVSEKGKALMREFAARIRRTGSEEQIIKDVCELIEEYLPESRPLVTSCMEIPEDFPAVTSCNDNCYRINLVHRYECGWAKGDIEEGMACVSISRKCFARLGIVVAVKKDTSEAIFFVAEHKKRDADSSDEPEFTDFGGILPKKRGILLHWCELLRCPQEFPSHLEH